MPTRMEQRPGQTRSQDRFKKWYPDLILLSHQGRGGLDVGELAPELQRGVGMRGTEG